MRPAGWGRARRPTSAWAPTRSAALHADWPLAGGGAASEDTALNEIGAGDKAAFRCHSR